MDIGIVLGIIGIFITILVAIFGVKYFAKPEITFYIESLTNLFDSYVKNLNDLKILYKDNNISQNLYFCKFFVMNSGYKDITPSMIEKKVKIKIPESTTWLEVNIVDQSEGLKVSQRLEDSHSLEVDFGLFRAKEFIQFEALLNSNEIIKSREKLGKDFFKHEYRIADAKKTKYRLLDPKLFKISSTVIVLTILLGISISFGFLDSAKRVSMEYYFKTKQGEYIQVEIIPIDKDLLKVRGISHPFEEDFKARYFFIENDVRTSIKHKSTSRNAILIIFVVAYVLSTIGASYSYYKQKNLLKCLGYSV